jgi:hypothetical protein
MLPVFLRTLRGGADADSSDEADDDEEEKTPPKVPMLTPIKRGNRFLAIYTEKLTFLDMVNYLAPGCSYAK